MKAYKFYNAVYGDGERMTGTLDEIYAAQQGRKVEISPVIWAYKMKNGMVAVDFKTTSVSFTLGIFDGVLEAESACRALNRLRRTSSPA